MAESGGTLRRDRAWLAATAVSAMLWVTLRACVQSITIDEADTYLGFVARQFPAHWIPAANNQVLNSMLMRFFTLVLGPNHVSLRLPALIGGAIYIAASFFLARILARGIAFELVLFVCLVFNPFVQDYLVAARGYSMALGFLMAAICAGFRQGISPRVAAAAASLAIALSFAANFSFAIADAAALVLILFWICRRVPPKESARILAAGVLPGLGVALLLTGPVVLAWPKGQFTWGAGSLSEMLLSVMKASWYEPNAYYVNAWLYGWLIHWRRLLFPLLGAVCLWRLAALALDRSWIREPRSRRLAALGTIAAGIAAISVAGHWLLFRLAHIPLPLDRTALYLAPMCTVAAGSIAAIPLPARMGRASGQAAAGMLAILAVYFLLCVRLSYFKEWKWNADAKQVYSVLTYYNRIYGVRDVSINWRYVSALNYYRLTLGRGNLGVFVRTSAGAGEYPAGKPAYVLFYPSDRDFAGSQGLKVVYEEPSTGSVVAIRPEVERARPCPQ